MFTPQLEPLGSLTLSALVALLPLLVMFFTLGVLKWKAHWAGLASLATALLVAIFAFKMPAGLALLAGTQGAVFGLFPITWIVLTAVWLYELTVVSGRFEDLRGTFNLISDDPRILAVLIAFCFGGLLEALAGFGAPVAIMIRKAGGAAREERVARGAAIDGEEHLPRRAGKQRLCRGFLLSARTVTR